MARFYDQFRTDSGWVKAGSYVDSTKSISSNVLTFTFGTTEGKSAWKKDGWGGRNVSIVCRAGASVAGYPQIHLRETDENNYLVSYINPNDGTLNIGHVTSGSYTSLGSVSITSFNSASTYTFCAEVWENCFHAVILRTDGNVDVRVENISSTVENFTGTSGGIGLKTGTQKYAWCIFRTLDYFVSAVAVGDSNVGASHYTMWPEQLLKKKLGQGFVIRNHGTAGYSTAAIYNDRNARIAPYAGVKKAKNLVIIGTGNNDFAVESKTASQTYDVQKTLISYCQGLGFECQLNTLMQFVYTPDARQFVEDLNGLILGGRSTYNYTSADIYTAFGCVAGSTDVNPAELRNTADGGIHYSSPTGRSYASTIIARTAFNSERRAVT